LKKRTTVPALFSTDTQRRRLSGGGDCELSFIYRGEPRRDDASDERRLRIVVS